MMVRVGLAEREGSLVTALAVVAADATLGDGRWGSVQVVGTVGMYHGLGSRRGAAGAAEGSVAVVATTRSGERGPASSILGIARAMAAGTER